MSAFTWDRWPTHYKTVFYKYGEDGSKWGIDYHRFGQDFHCGVDIKSGLYGEIMAVASGRVKSITYRDWGLGLYITLQHTDRFETVYGHLSRVFVQVGESVAPGQVIAWSGWTGNTKGDEQHLHIGQVDWQEGVRGCFDKYVDPAPFYAHLLHGPAAGERYDIYDYMAGDGRSYDLRSTLGQEACHTAYSKDGRETFQVKNSQWEQFSADQNFVYRGIDTSPGAGKYYVHYSPDGSQGAPWAKRYMEIGELFCSEKIVRFYNKDSAHFVAEYQVSDTIKLERHFDTYTSHFGYTVPDVIQLIWLEGGEHYFYAKDFGLVGWKSGNGQHYSGIVGLTDERHEMEKIAGSL